MKAAIFNGPNQPLELKEVPTPTPGPGQLLIKTAACGVCHTDIDLQETADHSGA